MADFAVHSLTESPVAITGMCEPIATDLDITPYLVNDAREIAQVLHSMVQHGAVVIWHQPLHGISCPGWLVAAQEGFFAFQVACEVEALPGSWVFVAMLQGVKVQFSCETGNLVQIGSRISLPQPAALIWLQRRRYARLNAPLGQFQAAFVAGARSYELCIEDIALGGVGLRASPFEATLLHVGRKLKRVSLLLGPDERVSVDMDVRSRRPWHTYLLGEQFHVGCRFIELSPEARDGLQRVMLKFGHALSGPGNERKE